MPTKTKGNSQKSLNPADDMWADKLAADLSRLETVGSSDEEAAVKRAKSRNENSDAYVDDSDSDDIDQEDAAEAVRDQEKNNKSNWRTNVEKRRKLVERGNMMARFLPGAKGNKWATGGIIGLLFGGAFGGSVIIAGPFSLLANFHDMSTNHTSIGQHVYTKFGNSYLGAFLAGKDRNCTGKIECKFKNITEKRKVQLEKRGFTVRTAPSVIPGLLKLQGLEFKEGNKVTVVDTRAKFQSLRYTNFTMFAQLQRIPLLAQFLHPNAAMNQAFKKFGVTISDKLRSIKDPDKQKRVEENRKATNAKTGADNDPAKNAERIRTKVSNAGKTEVDKLKAKLTSFSNSVKTSAGAAVWLPFTGCVAYDVIRIAKGAMMLAWHEELIKFAAPFLSAGAMAKEGDIDWETAEMYGDRLTKPVTQADIDNNPDVYTQDQLGKTAMDSKAMGAVINGDSAKIEGTYAEKYTSWSPSDDIIGSGVFNKINEAFPGGDQGIKLACQAIVYSMLLFLRGCIATKVAFLGCLAIAAGQFALLNTFADDILKWITDVISGPALEAIEKSGLDADLHGPALGEGLIAARGILGNYMDRASAFPVATSADGVAKAYTDMYTDKDYMQEQIAYEKYEASKNQFDISNQYSFVGQIVSRVASVSGGATIFSMIANIPKIVSPNTLFEATARAAKEGVYQPIQIFHDQKTIAGTIENCQDPMLMGDNIGIDIPGMGESCHTVPVIPSTAQDCLDSEQTNPDTVCIEKAIKYLSTNTYLDIEDEFKPKPYIDGDTGIPTGFDQFKEEEEGDYPNPLLMYLKYCGPTRQLPPGYTTKSISTTALDKIDLGEELKSIADSPAKTMMNATEAAGKEIYDQFIAPNDSWYDFNYCGDGRWAESAIGNEETYAWMSYYIIQCFIHASEEGTEYCWDDAPEEETTPTECGMIGSSPSLGSFTTGNGTRQSPRMIFVHTTEGDSLDGMTQALRLHSTSYHVAIDESGKAHRLVSDDQITNGTLSANSAALNIALVGHADQGDRLDPNSPQMKTLSGCIKDWAAEYSIPVEKVSGPGILNGGSTKGVAGHLDAANAGGYNNRFDPGYRFPWSEVLANAK